FPSIVSTYQELGSLRLLSPAGFTGDCNSVCTTNEEDNGTPVMPLIGFAGDDDHWVALKGGTFTLDRNANRIYTSPDARLVLADFSDPTVITSMPVLRGEFEAPGGGSLLSRISTPADTYLLVKSPLHAQDTTSGWDYEIELDADFLHAFGPLVRQVRPTSGYASTSFSFDADWRINAHGGPALQGQVALNSVSNSTINVGTLLLTPPNAGYGIEYNPQHASAINPAALPLFLQLRMAGATIAQPANLGGARLPVQGLLLPPGQSVKDANGNNVALECGNHCLDLRGDPDAMTASGPLIDREYRMPDLIVQDTANTIMVNTPGGVDVWSSDHPLAAPAAGGVNFNYEAFEGSVRTYRGPCPGARDPLNPDQQAPPGPETTVIVGSAGMVLPNAGADSGDLSGGPRIQAGFTLCEGSLREMMFVFDTGTQTAIPLGNSGMFLNFIGGTVSLTPQQPGSQAYTTVVLDMRFRGMSPQQASSTILSRGVVTIDSRGLFDVQVQTGVQVFSSIGAGVDGHFWVAWSPLDLGFEVEGCIPYNGFEPVDFPSSLCDGNELLYGMLRMHLWQGQGWQNAYDWLPDDDALHVASRFEARLTLAAGLIIDWGLVVLPPDDITLAGLKLAFGEFCTNGPCTAYEWGVMGAFTLLGYDIGAYYGFDSGISFIMGSADYVLIDEASLVMSSLPPDAVRLRRGPNGVTQATVTIQPGQESALFALGWQNGSAGLTLTEPPPGNRIIDLNTVAPDVTVATTPTAVSQQTILVIDQPLPGAWQVDFGNPAPTVDRRFVFFTNQPAPAVALSDLPQQAINQPSIPITWTSSISGNGRISLYYEQIAGGLDPSQDAVGPIVERLPLTASGVYTWQLEGMASGSYRVFARIDNETAVAINGCGPGYLYDPDPTAAGCNTMLNPSLFMPIDQVYAPGSVRIRDTVPPDPPQGIGSRPEGISSVVVRWNPNAEKDLAGYLVTCQQGALTRLVRVVAQIQASQALSETARVNGLDAVPATCSVEAYDSSGNVSGPSAGTSSTPTGNIPLPPAAVQGLQLQPVGPTTIQVSWQLSPAAVQYLVYYSVVFSNGIRGPVAPVAAPALPVAVAPSLAGLLGGSGGSLTGGFRAAEGRSPLNAGSATQLTLSGLPTGATYEVWVRPMDADGRTGPASPAVRIVVGSSPQLFLPIVFGGQ
ncbi:MAG: fibronectin type III domain-containing protein, partial [Anaerolineales bacterium]|nr:fibronectin type III domain-containing protein [Anaerolineales bacterium]